ncbi:MAG: GNAT family N-acetyltransferase/HAD family hydrolase [Oscillospiraceae bacterium]|nr:GNAT family N-acetyltransferase/HAD family hydrolase [Oscillospiraceae bacterium]
MSVILKTPRLLLRELAPEDLAALRPILQDSQAADVWGHALSDDEILRFIGENRNRRREAGEGYLAAVLHATGETAGVIGPLRGSVGCVLGQDYQGRGLAREGVRACLEYLFSRGLPAVTVRIPSKNLPARRMAESLGMRRDGSAFAPGSGQDLPSLAYRITREEFAAQPGPDTALRAVVFDMDGTLFDTEGVEYRAAGRIEREQSLPGVQTMLLEALGMTQEKSVELFRRHFDSEEAYEAFSSLLSRYYLEGVTPVVPEKPGLHQLLTYLGESGLKVALATSSDRACVERCFKSAGIAPYFHTVVTGEMFRHSKPHPEIYLAAAKALGVPPWQCLAVEDSFAGVRSAHGAGMQVAMVPDLIPPTKELLSLCHCRVDTLDGLIPVLSALRRAAEDGPQP